MEKGTGFRVQEFRATVIPVKTGIQFGGQGTEIRIQ
jgi:hypothetical protein